MIFELFQNIASADLCKPIHGIINYSTFVCPFESGKCWNEEKKTLYKTKTVINYKTLNISRRKKAF